MLAGVPATAIWLLWRKSSEPEVALHAAAFMYLSFWTPLFYIASILPSSTSWAGSVAQTAAFVLLTIVGLLLSF